MSSVRKRIAVVGIGAALIVSGLAVWLLVRSCSQRHGSGSQSAQHRKVGQEGMRDRILVHIVGRFVDRQGAGVKGALVLVTRYGLGFAAPDTVPSTNEKGEFSVDVQGPGVVDLELQARGCARVFRRIEMRGRGGGGGREPRIVDLGTLRCVPGGRLVGQVVDEKGHGLGGALVVARPWNPMGLGRARSTLTDRSGRFGLDHLPVGRYEVSVSAPGYSLQVLEDVEVPGRMPLVALSPRVTVEGVVTQAGKPVAGAFVRIVGSGIWPGLVVETDRKGRFRFQDAARGIYALEAWTNGMRSRPLSGLLVGLGTTGCAVELLEDVSGGHEGPGADAKEKETGRARADGGTGAESERDAGAVAPPPATVGSCPVLRLELLPALTLEGRVVEADSGQGLAGVRLVLGRGLLTSLASRVETDENGAFRIRAVLPGRYYLAADRDGYLSLSGVRLRVSRSSGVSSPDMSGIQESFSGSLARLRIVMDKGAGIAGLVVDDVGNPVAGARLSVVYAGRGLWAGTWSDRTEQVRRAVFERALGSGGSGLAVHESLGVVAGPVPALPRESLAVSPGASGSSGAGLGGDVTGGWGRAAGPGRPSDVVVVDLDSGAHRKDLRAGSHGGPGGDAGDRTDASVVQGRDAGAGDASLSDAGTSDAQVVPATRPERFVTDALGRFHIQGLPPGRAVILVTHPKYAEGRSGRLRLRIGKVRDGIRIVVHPGVDVEGRVDDESGAPLRGVFVTATDRLGLVVGRFTRTNRDGAFSLRNLAGTVHLRFERPDFLPLVLKLKLRRSQGVHRVRVSLKRADRELTGRVTDPRDHPISGVLVEAVSLDPVSPGRSAAITDDKGDFRVRRLGAVPYLFRLSHPDYPPKEIRGLDMTRPVHLVLRYGGGFEALVRDRQTKAVLRNVTLRLSGPAGGTMTRMFRDGKIRWVGLAPGRYRVTILVPGYASKDLSLSIVEADGPGQVTLRDQQWWLDLSGALRGLVSDDRGFQVFRAVVWCEGGGAGAGAGAGRNSGGKGHLPPAKGMVSTDHKGRFVLTDLPVGTCILRAEHPDSGTAEMSVEVQPGPARGEVVVDLSGRGAAGSGRIVSGVAVQLVGRGDDVVISRVVSGSKAEAAGLRAGDVISGIDGQPVEGEGLSDLARRLEGPVGSTVVIEIERAGRKMTIPVEREMLSDGH